MSSPDSAIGVAVNTTLPRYPGGSCGLNLDRPSVATYNLVNWSFGSPRALHAHRHRWAARISYVLYAVFPPSFLAAALRALSWSRVSFRTVVEAFRVELPVVVFMVGGRWYSTWSKVGVGGSRDRRSVRSVKGGTAMERPRVMSDHMLMKWIDDNPSARV